MLLRRSRSDLDGHFLRGRLHLARGESTEAIQDFQKVLKAEPGLPLAQMAKQVARGVYQRALARLREGTARLPDNAELQYHLGMAAARTALAPAAASPARFKGKDEASRTLGELRCGSSPRSRAHSPAGPEGFLQEWDPWGG